MENWIKFCDCSEVGRIEKYIFEAILLILEAISRDHQGN